MVPIGVEIFLVLLFLVLHAFFSLSETSVLNVRKSRLREMLDDETLSEGRARRAQMVLKFKTNPENFIATVQSGAVFFGFLSATYAIFVGEDHIWPWLHKVFGWSSETSVNLALIAVIFIVAVLNLTFGALIPKSIALHRSESIAFGLAPVLDVIVKLLRPIVHLPVLLSNLLLKPFKDRTSFTESRISEEEFRVMLEEGARSGVIDKTENELIENIFDFQERTAREVMIPRIKMTALDIDTPRELVIERIIEEGFTRLPVYQDTMDNILGVIYSKDVLALIEHPQLIILFDIIRPVVFVPETKMLSELLRDFQREKLHMAIVVDEFGGTAGLITLEDIVEEIVGEIHDEYDEDSHHVEISADRHSLVLPANYSINDANRELGKLFGDFHIPDDEEYESVSGYVNKLFGHIPDTGEERETQGVHVVVTEKGPMSVTEVRFEEKGHTDTVTQTK